MKPIPEIPMSRLNKRELEQVAQSKAIDPVEEVERQERKELVGAVLKTLSKREREVMEFLFSYPDGCQHTSKEAEAELGVKQGTIEKTKASALRKLRQPSRLMLVRDYLPERHGPIEAINTSSKSLTHAIYGNDSERDASVTEYAKKRMEQVLSKKI